MCLLPDPVPLSSLSITPSLPRHNPYLHKIHMSPCIVFASPWSTSLLPRNSLFLSFSSIPWAWTYPRMVDCRNLQIREWSRDEIFSPTQGWAFKPFYSQEWSNSNFSCSLTGNITSHSMKNLPFHSLLRLKDEYCTYSHFITYTFLLKMLGECTFWAWEWKG